LRYSLYLQLYYSAMVFSKIHIFLFLSLATSLICAGCKKEERHPVPDVQVYFHINLQSDPEFFQLLTSGSSMVITSTMLGVSYIGYNNNGVIVYCGGDGEYLAYDRTCPYDMPKSIQVTTDGSSGVAVCPSCNSTYVFASRGAPTTNSSAHWPLKEYRTSFNPNTGDLVVSH